MGLCFFVFNQPLFLSHGRQLFFLNFNNQVFINKDLQADSL